MLDRRKAALRRMLNVSGTDITLDGAPLRALVRRNVADQPYNRVDITVHADDITGEPVHLTPVIIDGTEYTVLNEDNLRPRGGDDRWIIPLGAGQTATARIKRGRYEH